MPRSAKTMHERASIAVRIRRAATRCGTALLAAAAVACTAPPPEAPPLGIPSRTHVAYATGYRAMSSGWSGADDQWVFMGLDADWRPEGWPLWLVLEMQFAYADDEPDSATVFADYSNTYEFGVGLRKYFAAGQVEPFVGAGIALLGASVSESLDYGWSDTLDDDLVFGGYAEAGAYVPLSPMFALGLLVRYSQGEDYDLFDTDMSSASTSVLLLFGSRF